MQIAGVPDSIEWDKVLEFLTSIGIDPANVPAECDISINWHNIQTTVYAEDADGQRYLNTGTGDCARHSIAIPITHHGRAPVVPGADSKRSRRHADVH